MSLDCKQFSTFMFGVIWRYALLRAQVPCLPRHSLPPLYLVLFGVTLCFVNRYRVCLSFYSPEALVVHGNTS